MIIIRHWLHRTPRSFHHFWRAYSAQTNRIVSKANTADALISSEKSNIGEVFPGDSPNSTNTQPSSTIDWSTVFHGASAAPFSEKATQVLLSPIDSDDIEIKPDGLLYLPEIKYRRVLNKAFGPGGWALVPRGPHHSFGRTLTREWALVVSSRFVSLARGEQDYFSPDALVTATEGVKSNALMRCCKDIGIASELWDPVFIRKWKQENAMEVWATDIKTKQRKRVWRRKDEQLQYPYQEI